MAKPIETSDDLHQILQKRYFDNIDRGEPAEAVDALTQDVHWIHTPIWTEPDEDRGPTQVLQGRDEVLSLLEAYVSSSETRPTHSVRDVILNGHQAAFRAEVVGPSDRRVPFLGWIELEDGLIRQYIVSPEQL